MLCIKSPHSVIDRFRYHFLTRKSDCEFFHICSRSQGSSSLTPPARVTWDPRSLCSPSPRLLSFHQLNINYVDFFFFLQAGRSDNAVIRGSNVCNSSSCITLPCENLGQKWCEKYQESEGEGWETWQDRADSEPEPGQYFSINSNSHGKFWLHR